MPPRLPTQALDKGAPPAFLLNANAASGSTHAETPRHRLVRFIQPAPNIIFTPFYNKTIACMKKLYSTRKKAAAVVHKKAATNHAFSFFSTEKVTPEAAFATNNNSSTKVASKKRKGLSHC